MIGYELRLLRASLRQRPGLAALMTLSIAVAVACFVVGHGASQSQLRNPLPDHPRLRHLRFARGPQPAGADHREVAVILSRPGAFAAWADVAAVLPPGRPWRATATFAGTTSVRTEARGASRHAVRFCTRDFFSMFDRRFESGDAWSEADDGAGAARAVVDASTARALFGITDAVGKRLELAGSSVRITGVLGAQTVPHVHDFPKNDVLEPEGIYAPLQLAPTLGVPPRRVIASGRHDGSIAALYASHDAFLHLWAEPAGRDAARALEAHTHQHVARERSAGRTIGAPILESSEEFLLTYFDLATGYQLLRLYSWVAFASCLFGFTRLLLAKSLAYRGVAGVHRALGASRRVVYGRLMLEASVMSLAGGLLGITLSALGLWLVGRVVPQRVAEMTLDAELVLIGFAAALACGLLGSAYPALKLHRTQAASLLRYA